MNLDQTMLGQLCQHYLSRMPLRGHHEFLGQWDVTHHFDTVIIVHCNSRAAELEQMIENLDIPDTKVLVANCHLGEILASMNDPAISIEPKALLLCFNELVRLCATPPPSNPQAQNPSA